MGWNQYTRAEKLKVLVSTIGLIGLASAFIIGRLHEDRKQEILRLRGERTIGVVYGEYKPLKGGRQLKYYFIIRGKKYTYTETRDLHFPTDTGEMRVVVYDPEYPNRNRMLLHEPILDSIDLAGYIGKPIVVNP